MFALSAHARKGSARAEGKLAAAGEFAMLDRAFPENRRRTVTVVGQQSDAPLISPVTRDIHLVIVVEPLGALFVVCTVGLAGWGFSHFTRGRILRWGAARQRHEGLRIQHMQQGLGGVKDMKLLGREDDFLAQYKLHNVGSAQALQRQTTLQALPRLWLELLAVIGLAGLVLVMIGQGKALDVLLPTLPQSSLISTPSV